MSYIDDFKKYMEEFDKRWDKKVAELKADIEATYRDIYERNKDLNNG